MGDNYSTHLSVKFRRNGEKKAVKALQDLISRAKEDNTNYSLEEYAKQGIGTETFDDLMRIFFAGWKGQEVQIGEWRKVDGVSFLERKDKDGFVSYRNCFSCSYGWQGVMWTMFDTIAPFCTDGTSLGISFDEGYVEKEVTDGEAEEVDNESAEDVECGEDD